MAIIVIIVLLAMVAVLVKLWSKVYACNKRYDDMLNELTMLRATVKTDEKTLDVHSENLATLNAKVYDLENKGKQSRGSNRCEELAKRHEEFKELREVFNHSVADAALQMKISKRTAERYENWRLEQEKA